MTLARPPSAFCVPLASYWLLCAGFLDYEVKVPFNLMIVSGFVCKHMAVV